MSSRKTHRFCQAFHGRQKKQNFNVDGKAYTPGGSFSTNSEKLGKIARDPLNDTVAGAVVTVPAYFTDARRKATQDAAQLANLPLWRYQRADCGGTRLWHFPKKTIPKRQSLVYDLGGGTFDVCIMRIGGNKIETLAQEGDQDLGGYNFDEKIVNMFLKSPRKRLRCGIRSQSHARVMIVAEEAKKKLSKK